MNCDVCNRVVDAEAARRIPAELFRALMSRDWGIHASTVELLVRGGMGRSEAVATLREQYRQSETDWALCSACDNEAMTIVLNSDGIWLSPELITVSRTAATVGMGFSVLEAPVAMSRDVWSRCVEWGERDSQRQRDQEQDARLWDVMFTGGGTLQLRMGDLSSPKGHRYSVKCVPRDGESENEVPVALEMRVGQWRGHTWIFIEEACA